MGNKHPFDEVETFRVVDEDPKVLERLKAAEEFCHGFMLAMALGALNTVDQGWRDMLAKPLGVWADLAVETGIMKDGEDEAS